MCDTFAASPSVTVDKSVIFGKNSDRQPNEPHHILHAKGGKTNSQSVKCTYISIPQVEETYEIILSKPNWIWGAEMGANEHGLTIGNEAVWTTEQNNDEKLIGMDFLRLALERTTKAQDAIQEIARLLEEHGQGGNCGFATKEFYDNSFVIADPREAWIMETAGRFWIAEKVETIRTISNCLTIENKFDKIHPDLIDYAIDKGKCTSKNDFNFKQQFSAKYSIMRIGAKGDKRRACTLKILENDSGKISPKSAIAALRSHNTDSKYFNPRKSSMASPCVHSSSIFVPNQSTGSMVSHIRAENSIHWLTGTAAPCLSVFKPLIFSDLNYDFPLLKNTYTPNTLWYEHERLHRMTLKNYEKFKSIYDEERLKFEQTLFNKIYSDDYSLKLDKYGISDVSLKSFEKNLTLIEKWVKELQMEEHKSNLANLRYNFHWARLNRKAKLSKYV